MEGYSVGFLSGRHCLWPPLYRLNGYWDSKYNQQSQVYPEQNT